MLLKALFILAIVLGLIALMSSVKVKHINIGYTLTTFLLILADALCIALLECTTIKGARNLFLSYYLVNSWMFFGAVWTISRMSSGKRYDLSLIPMGLVSAFQSFLVIYCFNRPRMLEYKKELFLGSLWWTVSEMPGNKGLLTFGSYALVCYASCLVVFIVLAVCFAKAYSVHKQKYAVMAIFQFALLGLMWLYFNSSWPIWLFTLLMNPICYFAFYCAFFQSDIRLRESTLLAFANDMSDGLVLYNSYNDLIHMNAPMKEIPDTDLLEDLKDIAEVEKWFTQVEIVEGKEVLRLSGEDGDKYYIAKKKILGNEKTYTGTVYTFRDVTGMMEQLRAMKKANSELERTAKMKSDFLANMSHELRTPMNAVIGMTEIALREDVPDRVKDCLNQIRRSGSNLLNIINDILDYSKIEAGKMEIVPDNYEPLSEVNDISNILQSRIGDKDIVLFFAVDPALPKGLYGDSMRIRQVLINIANNAIKFTDKGFVLIKLVVEPKSEQEVILDFHVIDTGIGIKKEDLDRLFESFQQVNSKRNRSVEGTGLGLVISKKLCEAMGGSIQIQSEYGKGTDVGIRIPQKVGDPTRFLVIDEPENKIAFCMTEIPFMIEGFSIEMSSLGVESRIINNFDEYAPTGKKEFLFIDEALFTHDVEIFLDEHPDMTCIVSIGIHSDFTSDKKNIRPMRNPMNTLTYYLALNNKDISAVWGNRDKNGAVKFTAPDAKVLIVDDNSINLTIAQGLIEPMKIQCATALSGPEALEILKKEHFDLILMDHMMPGMDGIEATRAIRETIPDAADTPIIALTANVAEGSMEMFIKAGMADLIAKPIDVKQLNSKLSQWLPEDKIIEENVERTEDGATAVSEDTDLYDCLDCAKAIEALGSPVLFKKIVADYYRKGPAIYQAIEDATARGDWNDYTIRMHSLKSTSRQIGATELGDLAEKLEKAGKAAEAEVVEMYHSVTMQTFKTLLESLSKYFGGEGVPEEQHAGISEDELAGILDELVRACDELDMDAMEACGERLKEGQFPDEIRKYTDRICMAIEKMDTDECEAVIGEYLEAHKA